MWNFLLRLPRLGAVNSEGVWMMLGAVEGAEERQGGRRGRKEGKQRKGDVLGLILYWHGASPFLPLLPPNPSYVRERWRRKREGGDTRENKGLWDGRSNGGCKVRKGEGREVKRGKRGEEKKWKTRTPPLSWHTRFIAVISFNLTTSY